LIDRLTVQQRMEAFAESHKKITRVRNARNPKKKREPSRCTGKKSEVGGTWDTWKTLNDFSKKAKKPRKKKTL